MSYEFLNISKYDGISIGTNICIHVLVLMLVLVSICIGFGKSRISWISVSVREIMDGLFKLNTLGVLDCWPACAMFGAVDGGASFLQCFSLRSLAAAFSNSGSSFHRAPGE